jgi:hypothetical protein
MSIEELGSIGDLLAAVATIFALIYLALQIRQSNTLLKHEKVRGFQDDADRWRSYLISDKEIAKIYREGLRSPDGLDQDDKLRFLMLQDQLFFGWQYIYLNEAGMEAEDPKYFIRNTLNQPGGEAYWESRKSLFNNSFVDYVEACHHNEQENP